MKNQSRINVRSQILSHTAVDLEPARLEPKRMHAKRVVLLRRQMKLHLP